MTQHMTPRCGFRKSAIATLWVAASLFLISLYALGAHAADALPLIDLEIVGAVGDGSTLNDAAMQAGFTAAANGGKIRLPCGTYKIAATPSVTVAAGRHVDLEGAGSDCTTILVSGAVNGPTFNFASPYSSVSVHDLTIASDQEGGTSCLVFNGTFKNDNPAYSAASSLSNVTFRGRDSYGALTKYCGDGFFESGISNISIFNEYCVGTAKRTGLCNNFIGNLSTKTYSVQINIAHSNGEVCAEFVRYGDYVQGVALANDNATGCHYGVNVPANPTGGLSELFVDNTQLNVDVCGVCDNDPTFGNLQMMNNFFIVASGGAAIRVEGSDFTIMGNQIGALSAANTQAIIVGSTFGNGGVIAHNSFVGFNLAVGVLAASHGPLRLTENQFVGNKADYSVNASASNVIVHDDQPRTVANLISNLPCDAAIQRSQGETYDTVKTPWSASVTAASGGADNFYGLKCDGRRWYVD